MGWYKPDEISCGLGANRATTETKTPDSMRVSIL